MERLQKLHEEMKNGEYVLKINSQRTDHLDRFVMDESAYYEIRCE